MGRRGWSKGMEQKIDIKDIALRVIKGARDPFLHSVQSSCMLALNPDLVYPNTPPVSIEFSMCVPFDVPF